MRIRRILGKPHRAVPALQGLDSLSPGACRKHGSFAPLPHGRIFPRPVMQTARTAPYPHESKRPPSQPPAARILLEPPGFSAQKSSLAPPLRALWHYRQKSKGGVWSFPLFSHYSPVCASRESGPDCFIYFSGSAPCQVMVNSSSARAYIP